MTSRIRNLIVLTIVISPTLGFASEAYLLRFSAVGKAYVCNEAAWGSDVLFYNENPTPATVRLLGISNGDLLPGTATTLTLPSRQTISLDLQASSNAEWVPANSPAFNLWVIHVDIPPNVIVENRDVVTDFEFCTPEHFSGGSSKVSLPIIRSLTPAGTRQVKLGTDIGTTRGRQNVAVYNGGDQLATAIIEVRRGCDDALMDSRIITVPPNIILQANGLDTGPSMCTVGTMGQYVRYTVVTVDQPSFSIVSTVTEAQPQAPGDIVPLVELAVAINSIF